MKWILLSGSLLLTACATETTKPIVIDSKPIDRPNLNLPTVDEFRANDVNWIIITPENVEQIFADLESRGEAVVIFGVTERGYENIAINNKQALRVILQQQTVIAGYKKYYIITDQNIANHNTNK